MRSRQGVRAVGSVCVLMCLGLISVRGRAFATPETRAVRGLTIGPIESALHPGKGYGSEPYERAVREARSWGASWVSITPFGRTYDLRPTGIDLSFEMPFDDNRRAVIAAIRGAHAQGLRVLLVPHLWVETGKWRAEIDPGTELGWARWAEAYGDFIVRWAQVARDAQADMFSVGVELRSWVTTSRATSFVDVIRAVRGVYAGPLTYSANWDDVDQTVILGELDVIGINAFYPLTDKDDASFEDLLQGGRKVAARVQALGETWARPVLFTEVGYTTRRDPALRPWEWPDTMADVKPDQRAQALAYKALIAPLLEVPTFAGFFVWRVYADPDDMSQEAEWGFSPRGKLAETVVRDAFTAWWARDGEPEVGQPLVAFRADDRVLMPRNR